MKSSIEFKNFEPNERVRTLINDQIAKIAKKVKNFAPDSVFLRVFVEENAVRTLYHTAITMEVPGKTLATKEDRHDIAISMKDAFSEIDRKLQEHKSRLRKEHFWKRIGRRQELRELKIKYRAG